MLLLQLSIGEWNKQTGCVCVIRIIFFTIICKLSTIPARWGCTQWHTVYVVYTKHTQEKWHPARINIKLQSKFTECAFFQSCANQCFLKDPKVLCTRPCFTARGATISCSTPRETTLHAHSTSFQKEQVHFLEKKGKGKTERGKDHLIFTKNWVAVLTASCPKLTVPRVLKQVSGWSGGLVAYLGYCGRWIAVGLSTKRIGESRGCRLSDL